MKKQYIWWIVFLFISYMGFLIIEHVLTFKPDVISGNGNLGIIGMFVFIPITLVSLYLTFDLFKNQLIKVNGVLFIIVVISSVLFAYLAFNYVIDLLDALGGGPNVEASIIYRYGYLNQFTNSFYFNTYTFLFIHSLAVILGIISRKRDRSI